jgi:ABC-2 type transport system permease protein
MRAQDGRSCALTFCSRHGLGGAAERRAPSFATVPYMRKYFAMARVSFGVIFVYRAAFALNMFGTLFYVVAMFFLWQTIFLGKPGALGAFSWPQMKAYLLVGFLMNSLMTAFDEGDMARDVRMGRIATDLARPIDFQARRLAEAAGPLPIELISALLVGAVVIFAFGGVAAPPDGAHLALFVVSAAVATLLKFGLVYCVSMAAFWTTGMVGIRVGRTAIQNLLSGAMIPLAFFPDWLRSASAVLPFQGLVSTPALTYLGQIDGSSTALLIGVQAFWAVALLLLGRAIWGRAVTAVTIHGG